MNLAGDAVDRLHPARSATVFDFGFKAHMKNVELLADAPHGGRATARDWLIVVGAALRSTWRDGPGDLGHRRALPRAVSGSVRAVRLALLADLLAVRLLDRREARGRRSDASARRNHDRRRPEPCSRRRRSTSRRRSGDVAVNVEVVATEAKIEKGLMYRQHLPLDAGMLFLMGHEKDWTFWMRNTLIPLDMLFITKDMTVAGIVENAEPKTETLRTRRQAVALRARGQRRLAASERRDRRREGPLREREVSVSAASPSRRPSPGRRASNGGISTGTVAVWSRAPR